MDLPSISTAQSIGRGHELLWTSSPLDASFHAFKALRRLSNVNLQKDF